MKCTTNRLYYLFLSPLQEQDYRGWGPLAEGVSVEPTEDPVKNGVSFNDC